MSGVGGAPRAPGERQPAAAGLHSGAMMMPLPYRPAAPARKGPGYYVVGPEGAPVLDPAPSPARSGANGGAAGFGAEIFFNRAIYAPVRRSMNVDGSRRGVPLKMGNFVRVLSNFAPKGSLPQRGPCGPGHSAPLPILPAGKLNTTSTVLSSGEALKKTNSVGVLSNFRGSSWSRFGGRSPGALCVPEARPKAGLAVLMLPAFSPLLFQSSIDIRHSSIINAPSHQSPVTNHQFICSHPSCRRPSDMPNFRSEFPGLTGVSVSC